MPNSVPDELGCTAVLMLPAEELGTGVGTLVLHKASREIGALRNSRCQRT